MWQLLWAEDCWLLMKKWSRIFLSWFFLFKSFFNISIIIVFALLSNWYHLMRLFLCWSSSSSKKIILNLCLHKSDMTTHTWIQSWIINTCFNKFFPVQWKMFWKLSMKFFQQKYYIWVVDTTIYISGHFRWEKNFPDIKITLPNYNSRFLLLKRW